MTSTLSPLSQPLKLKEVAPRATSCPSHLVVKVLCHVRCRFVSRKDPHANVVYVSRHYYDEERRRDSFICGGFNWIGAERPDAGRPLHCKVRHGPNMYRCAPFSRHTSSKPH